MEMFISAELLRLMHQHNATPTDDRALIVQARAGDLAAWGTLVKRHQQAVYNVCYRLLNNRHDAEDMVQESFIRAWRKLAMFDEKRPFAPWMKRVAANVCFNHLKSQAADEVPLDEERDAAPALEQPGQAQARRESAETVRSAIATLPAPYRIALELRHFQELSYDEMAATLNLPKNTVRSHLHRARKLLAERLKDHA